MSFCLRNRWNMYCSFKVTQLIFSLNFIYELSRKVTILCEPTKSPYYLIKPSETQRTSHTTSGVLPQVYYILNIVHLTLPQVYNGEPQVYYPVNYIVNIIIGVMYGYTIVQCVWGEGGRESSEHYIIRNYRELCKRAALLNYMRYH